MVVNARITPHHGHNQSPPNDDHVQSVDQKEVLLQAQKKAIARSMCETKSTKQILDRMDAMYWSKESPTNANGNSPDQNLQLDDDVGDPELAELRFVHAILNSP
jgi:hypothetical protein